MKNGNEFDRQSRKVGHSCSAVESMSPPARFIYLLTLRASVIPSGRFDQQEDSVKSAWFKRTAATFAEAPFEATVSSPVSVAAVSAALLKCRRSRLVGLSLWLAQSNGNPAFAPRQALVTNYYNQGEFLNYFRFAASTVYGSGNPIPIGGQPISRAVATDEDALDCGAGFVPQATN